MTSADRQSQPRKFENPEADQDERALGKLAIDDLFAELGMTPEITAHGMVTRYRAPPIEIFVGDIA